MKRMIPIFLCSLLLTGCALIEPMPTIAPSAPPRPTEPAAAVTEAPTGAPTEAPTVAPTQAPSLTITVYHGDDNAEKILAEEVSVAEINETTVMEALISAGVLRDGTAVNSMTKNGDHLEVDFNQAFADLVCSMGTSGEYIIVGSTVNTFLMAFNAQSMFFTVNGEILESGHVIYDFPMEFMS